MRSAVFSLMMVAVLIGATACGEGEKENEETAADAVPEELIRGHYLFAHEVRALRPCGEDEDVWVIDRSGILAREFQQLVGISPQDVRISVIATGSKGPAPDDGFGGDYPGSVTIDEVIYAAREGFGCEFDLTGFIFRANGNEPFWMVEILPAGMRFSQPGGPEVFWPEVSAKRQGDLLVFHGTGADKAATLTIEPGPGYDDMSGSYFHHRARFEWNGTMFEGPAMRGRADSGGR